MVREAVGGHTKVIPKDVYLGVGRGRRPGKCFPGCLEAPGLEVSRVGSDFLKAVKGLECVCFDPLSGSSWGPGHSTDA